MIKNTKCIKEVKNICDEVNSVSQSNVKTGMCHMDEHISIYDSNCYDDMFGFQVIGRIQIDEDQLENEYYKNQLKAELISKVCNITGMSVWATNQKK
jgi:hypothetical protein